MGAERRVTHRLVEYWKSLKGERPYPAESEVNPEELKDIWDACFLIQVNPNALKRGLHYSYLGPSLIEAFGEDFTGYDVSDVLISPMADRVVKKVHETINTKGPVVDESEFVNTKNMLIKYRQCMVPLGWSGRPIDYVIGAMKWKGF